LIPKRGLIGLGETHRSFEGHFRGQDDSTMQRGESLDGKNNDLKSRKYFNLQAVSDLMFQKEPEDLL